MVAVARTVRSKKPRQVVHPQVLDGLTAQIRAFRAFRPIGSLHLDLRYPAAGLGWPPAGDAERSGRKAAAAVSRHGLGYHNGYLNTILQPIRRTSGSPLF
jgi:hypothetical protein